MSRVKFYSINDLMYGHNLSNCHRLLLDYDSGVKEAQDVNDIIELYNTKKYLDNKVYLADWTSEIMAQLERISNEKIGIIARFIKSIDNDNLLDIYNKVNRNYKDDFWELFDKFKVYENISNDYFKEFLQTSKVSLLELLHCKNITNHFGEIIRENMLNNSSSAELLLDKYEKKHRQEPAPIYLPKELNNSDKEAIISNYIDTEDPNPNYLQLITNIQSSKDKLEISPKILLKAKRRAEEQNEHFFEENSGIRSETKVIFSKHQDEEALLVIEDQSISATYSTNWIDNNADFATLLNNFIYLFEIVDLHMRCTLVNKVSEMGVFEKFIFMSSQNAYNKGFSFDQKNILSLLQLSGYYHHLFSIGIRLEEVIEWFFEDYVPREFEAHNFKVTMPSANSTFLEKCTNIMPALESVLKQFILYVEDGQIDFELLEIKSDHLIYKNIPSLISRKYVYGLGDEFKTVTFLFFSDQSSLAYHEKPEDSYGNFFELLCNEKIKLIEIADYNIQKVNLLLDLKYLSIDEDGFIVFSDKQLILLLRDLYMNDVIAYWKCSNYGRTIIDDLEKRNVIEIESSLFSRPEQDYINYTLNKSQFNNGLDLRNRYSHTQPNSDENERIHNQNYLIFLRLFIISVIKINDEFCTSTEINNKSE